MVDRTFRAGDRVDFRTVVNPTSSRTPTVSGDPDGRGHRFAHKHPEHVKKWFGRRLQKPGEPPVADDGVARIGADADTGRLALRILPRVSSHQAHAGMRIARAEIRGVLTVTDPVAFVKALTQGVGRARAYSCGLILVR